MSDSYTPLETALLALVPFVNVAVLAAVLWLILVPRAVEGHTLAVVATAVLLALGIPMVAAAVVFSVSVLRGSYPLPTQR